MTQKKNIKLLNGTFIGIISRTMFVWLTATHIIFNEGDTKCNYDDLIIKSTTSR